MCGVCEVRVRRLCGPCAAFVRSCAVVCGCVRLCAAVCGKICRHKLERRANLRPLSSWRTTSVLLVNLHCYLMEEDLLIVTEAQLIQVGLKLVGRTDKEIRKSGLKGNRRYFAGHYGSSPFTCAQIWEALQVTTIEEARIEGPLKLLRKYLDMFLMTLHWLKGYSTEVVRATTFHVSEKTCRQWSWYFVEKIAALKEEKVSE